MLNTPDANSDYEHISEDSTTAEKIDTAIGILQRKSGPNYIDYHSLKIPHNRENWFDAELLNTGFVEATKSHHGDYHPVFTVSHRGHLLLERHGSFLEYSIHELNKHEQQAANEIEHKIIETKIKGLTLLNLQFQEENKQLKLQLDNSILELSQLQKEDIPKNAEDRKTIIHWQVATGVAILVAFLLKLFGVKGWLE